MRVVVVYGEIKSKEPFIRCGPFEDAIGDLSEAFPIKGALVRRQRRYLQGSAEAGAEVVVHTGPVLAGIEAVTRGVEAVGESVAIVVDEVIAAKGLVLATEGAALACEGGGAVTGEPSVEAGAAGVVGHRGEGGAASAGVGLGAGGGVGVGVAVAPHVGWLCGVGLGVW